VNWWQVIVIAGAILFAGLYVGNGIAGLADGFRDIAQRLESLAAGTCAVIRDLSMDISEQLEAGREPGKGESK
jgi:hypothetical protein